MFPDSRKSYITEEETTITNVNTIRLCAILILRTIMVAGHTFCAKIGVLGYNTRVKTNYMTTYLKTIIFMVEESIGSGSII